ncbi:MAG: MFS transporter [Sphaerobacteraceae bacterium]|nr:MAG: MFS transporter [Sphaerobacteraceae bacterium]
MTTQNPAQGRTEDRGDWGMLALAWLLYFAFSITAASLFPLVTPVRDELDLSYSQMGIILGAWQLVYIGAAIPVGTMIDRIGTKRSLLFGALIIAASGLTRSLAPNFPIMLGAVAMFGLGGPIISIGLPKLVAEWFTGKKRGLASGIYVTGSHAGNVVVLAITNSLIMPLVGSWRTTLQIYAGVVLVIALLWFLLGRESEDFKAQQKARDEGTDHEKSASIRDIIGIGAIWPVIIIGFSGFLSSHGFRSWLPQIFEDKGMSPATAGFLAAVPAITGMIGSIIIVRIASEGYRRQMTIGLLFTVGLTIGLIGVLSGPLLVATVMIQGFSAAALMPLMMNTLMEMPEVGARYLGVAAGLYFSIGEIGGFAGPALVGFLADLTGSFLAGIFALSIVMWLMIIPALRIKDRPRSAET